MAKSQEKTFTAATYRAKAGKLKSKFTGAAATVDASVRFQLPKGQYVGQLHPMTIKEQENGVDIFIFPFTVTEGQYKGKRNSVRIMLNPNQCFNADQASRYGNDELEGVPFGMVNMSQAAQNLGIETMKNGKPRDFSDIVQDLENVASEEPIIELVVRESDPKKVLKGPDAGKMKTFLNTDIAGIVSLNGDGGGDTGEGDDGSGEAGDTGEGEGDDGEGDNGEPAEPAFAVNAKVKWKKKEAGVVKKVNEDGTYNVKMNKDGAFKRNVAESDLS